MASKNPWTLDVVAYNRLPRLEAAKKKLDRLKPQFDAFVKEATEILGRTNLSQGEIGAFLLHRHWNIEPRQLMVERPRVLEDGKVALVTAAVPGQKTKGLAPCRWSATGTRPMTALEFSIDPFVVEIIGKLTKDKRLIADLGKTVEKHRLETIVGYMVIPRKSITVKPGGDFVETNFDRISVITGEILSPEERLTSIRTGWPLSISRQGSIYACSHYCSHGPDHTCRHPKPKPPICRPHGCV